MNALWQAKHFRPIGRKGVLVLCVVASLIGGLSIAPAFADGRDGHDRGGRHGDRGWRGSRGGHEGWGRRHEHWEFYGYGQPYYYGQSYGYAQPVYVPPPVFYAPQPAPGINLFRDYSAAGRLYGIASKCTP